jgi:hypothetical protein
MVAEKPTIEKPVGQVHQSDESPKALAAPYLNMPDSNQDGDLVSLGAWSFSI